MNTELKRTPPHMTFVPKQKHYEPSSCFRYRELNYLIVASCRRTNVIYYNELLTTLFFRAAKIKTPFFLFIICHCYYNSHFFSYPVCRLAQFRPRRDVKKKKKIRRFSELFRVKMPNRKFYANLKGIAGAPLEVRAKKLYGKWSRWWWRLKFVTRLHS